MKVSDEDFRRKESALVTLLEMLDLPSKRIEAKDWRWVSRNMGIRNANHPLYETAVRLVRWVIGNDPK